MSTMKTLVCLAVLLAAQGARAELFELKGTLACGFPTMLGALDSQQLSTAGIIAHALSRDPRETKGFALVYDSHGSKISVIERCNGEELQLVATNQSAGSTTGPESGGRASYAVTQLLKVADWDVDVELGTLACNFTGVLDTNTAELLTAKGTCAGALSITDGDQAFCSLEAKFGKPVQITNDCPT